jgi:hypothetical protein
VFICQWHLDIPYGRQSEVVRIMKAWGHEKFASSEFKRARSSRLLVGHVGVSASHIVDEYEFESLADGSFNMSPDPISALTARIRWGEAESRAPSTSRTS